MNFIHVPNQGTNTGEQMVSDITLWDVYYILLYLCLQTQPFHYLMEKMYC